MVAAGVETCGFTAGLGVGGTALVGGGGGSSGVSPGLAGTASGSGNGAGLAASDAATSAERIGPVRGPASWEVLVLVPFSPRPSVGATDGIGRNETTMVSSVGRSECAPGVFQSARPTAPCSATAAASGIQNGVDPVVIVPGPDFGARPFQPCIRQPFVFLLYPARAIRPQ